MKRVSLVATVHKEQGLANVSELVAILERISPDVIFLEIPSAVFDDYLDGTRGNLESTAARRYRDIHHVELVPVDLPTPEEEFFTNNQNLYERVEKATSEYCRLIDWNNQYVSAYGFAYLNSDRCGKLWSELHEVMLTTLVGIGEHRLVELYESWKRTNELRDKVMMKNIQEYCTLNTFDNGAFLVGAAHRQSIIELSREGSGSSTFQWDFSGFLDGALRDVGAPAQVLRFLGARPNMRLKLPGAHK
jgi:hypothetical protein